MCLPHLTLGELFPEFLDDEEGREKSTWGLKMLFPFQPRTDQSSYWIEHNNLLQTKSQNYYIICKGCWFEQDPGMPISALSFEVDKTKLWNNWTGCLSHFLIKRQYHWFYRMKYWRSWWHIYRTATEGSVTEFPLK